MSERLKAMHDKIEGIFALSLDHIHADILHRYIDEQQERIEELEAVVRKAPLPVSDDRQFWIQYGKWQAQALAALEKAE